MVSEKLGDITIGQFLEADLIVGVIIVVLFGLGWLAKNRIL